MIFQGIRDLPVIYLRPAEMIFRAGRENQPARIITVLGSCVSVVFYSEQFQLASICHALLPESQSCCKSDQDQSSYKYMECVLPEMIRKLERYDTAARSTNIYLFGGSEMFRRGPNTVRPMSVGRSNIDKAREILESSGLKIHKADVGGSFGRKIYFYPHVGRLEIKRLSKNTLDVRPLWKKF